MYAQSHRHLRGKAVKDNRDSLLFVNIHANRLESVQGHQLEGDAP
jgi:hypothetical protein